MSWLGMMALTAGIFVAYKVAGVLLKVIACAVLLVGGWWWLAPQMGWPTPWDVALVLSPW